MKVLIVVLVAAVCYVHANPALTPEDLEKKEQMLTECKAQTEVSDEDISLLKQHKLPETQNGKCFIACIKKKLGVLDADNKVNLDRVKELLEKVKEKVGDKYESIVKIAEKCAAEVPGGSDECEIAAKLTECVVREFKENDIDIEQFNLHAH